MKFERQNIPNDFFDISTLYFRNTGMLNMIKSNVKRFRNSL